MYEALQGRGRLLAPERILTSLSASIIDMLLFQLARVNRITWLTLLHQLPFYDEPDRLDEGRRKVLSVFSPIRR